MIAPVPTDGLRALAAAYARIARAMLPLVDVLHAYARALARPHRVAFYAIEHADVDEASIRAIDGNQVVLWNGRRITVDVPPAWTPTVYEIGSWEVWG